MAPSRGGVLDGERLCERASPLQAFMLTCWPVRGILGWRGKQTGTKLVQRKIE